MGSDAPLCYVWLGTIQKMANAAKCKQNILLVATFCSPWLQVVSLKLKNNNNNIYFVCR